MKKYILTILLTSLSSVLFAQWITPTPPTGTTTTNDKIGIGTTSPVSKVEVVGNMGSTAMLKLFNTDAVDGRSVISFGSNKSPSQAWEFGQNISGSNNIFGLRDITATGFPIRFVVNTQGYFGIGTSTPSTTLDVAGNTTLGVAQKDVTIQFRGYNGAYSQIFSNSGLSGNYNGLTLSNNTNGANSLPYWTLDIGGADNVNFQNSDSYSIRRMNAEVFRINSSGNVLIGKISQTNNAYKLDVAGSLRANAIVVNTTGADFVFENSYKLRPLSELESFVKANHHLPEIPSADQMKEKGMDVGELNKRLLQKVEELTLYLIEKDQQIKAQNESMKRQQSQIDLQSHLLNKFTKRIYKLENQKH